MNESYHVADPFEGTIKPMTVDQRPIEIDDALWEELIEITDGKAAPCFQCGVCTAACPWGLVRDDPLSVRSIMRGAQLGLLESQEAIWLCTACGQCEIYCPREVPIVEVFQNLRQLLWERRKTPAGLSPVLWSVYWNNNPLSQPPSQRMGWAENLDLQTYDSSKHEILMYFGCTASYDSRAQSVARALVQLLRAADVSFGILGEEEPCCGETVLRLGHSPYFQDVAQQATDIFEKYGVGKLVTVSPHCYDVFKNHYPYVNESFNPVHYTDYIAGLIERNRLTFEGSLSSKITFHDPCLLGRVNESTHPPRAILETIPDARVIEMPHSGPDTLCCGGGGGRMWMETPPGDRFSDLRVQEALDIGADIMATACPLCISCLEDSIGSMGVTKLKVFDIAEIAQMALGKMTTNDTVEE